MAEDCPDCGSQLRERRPNFLRNIRRREIENRYHRFVCPACEQTFRKEEVVRRFDKSISIKQWMEGTEHMRNGTFITVEGIDGAGKTGVVEAIAEEFDAAVTAEPSEFWTGEQVRRALQEETPSFTDFFLFMADRHFHIEEKIKPKVAEGEVVVSDRFADSTRVYQPVQLSGHLKDPYSWIERTMEPWRFKPDVTIYLDVGVEVGLERCDEDEKYENAGMLEQVKENYERLLEQEPERFVIIDAEQSKEEVQHAAVDVVAEVITNE